MQIFNLERTMNREQMKHLQERISAAKSRLLRSLYDDGAASDKPAAVVKAEATVAAWEAKRETAKNARREKALNAVRDTEEAMYFGDHEKAVAKVKWLEALKA
jgi:hypothetical protein